MPYLSLGSTSMLKLWNGSCLLVVFSICLFIVNPLWADEYSSQPFELRLWAAMSRSISSTDAIGRQASAAYPSGSSDNPAGVDVRDFELVSTRAYICAGTHHVIFSNGAWIAAGDVNGFFHFNNTGTISFGYIHIALPEGQTRQGFNNDLRDNEFLMKYGRKIHGKGYVGLSFRVRDMKLESGDLSQGVPRRTRNDSVGGSFTVGGLWRPKSDWTLGTLIEIGWIGSDLEGEVHLPNDTDVPFQLDLTTHTMNVKAGFGWKMSSKLTVYGDGQYFHLGNSMNTTDIGRFYFGGNIHLAQKVSLMAGGSLDTMRKGSASMGVGISMSARSLFKLTYQYNPLPDISYEFGTGHIVSSTVVFGF